MKIPTKNQISDALNAYLDLDIKWFLLEKTDLEKVVDLFDDPVELVRKLARGEAEEKIKDRSRDIVDKVEDALKQIPRPFGIMGWLLEKREK